MMEPALALPQPDQTWGTCHEWIMTTMRKISEDHGGPMQYLHAKYGTEELKQSFCDKLLSELPPDPRVSEEDKVHFSADWLKTVQLERPYCAHISMLAFMPASSTKPPPYRTVVTSLVDEYTTNTFLTRGDPLTVFSIPNISTDGAGCFWIGYVKGAARATTALAMVSIMLDEFGSGDACRALNPALWESLAMVWVKWVAHNPDLQKVSFLNAQLSARGAIRRANDIITWVIKIRNIEQLTNRAAADVVAAWNTEATRESQLVGMKRTGVLNLLHCENTSLDLLINHLSDNGIERVFFQDSTWSNKKLLPGHLWKLGAACWQLPVTHKTFLFMIKWLMKKQQAKPVNNQHQLNKMQMEEASQICALVSTVQERVLEKFPIQAEIMQGFIDGFLEGRDHQLELELQSELQMKNASFKAEEHITFIKDMVLQHQKTSRALRPAAALCLARPCFAGSAVQYSKYFEVPVSYHIFHELRRVQPQKHKHRLKKQ